MVSVTFGLGSADPIVSPGTFAASVVFCTIVWLLFIADKTRLAAGCDVPLAGKLALFIGWFELVRWLAGKVMDHWGWKRGSEQFVLAQSYLVAQVHGGPATAMCGWLVATRPFVLTGANDDLASWVLAYTAAYTLADTLILMRFCADEKVFLLHHYWVFVHMFTAICWKAGGHTGVLCILVAECTNPLQCMEGLLSLALLEDGFVPAADRAWIEVWHGRLARVFMASFATVRFVLAMPTLVYVCYAVLYAEQPGAVPLGLGAMWCIVIAIFYIGSLLWFAYTFVPKFKKDSAAAAARAAKDA